uniref:Uncharacterized protein n=1 Tax=Arundo donax TaxID=35708 RepID=A0A0A9EYU5_ARUDO
MRRRMRRRRVHVSGQPLTATGGGRGECGSGCGWWCGWKSGGASRPPRSMDDLAEPGVAT